MTSSEGNEAPPGQIRTAIPPPALREVMTEILREWGYAVDETPSDGVVLEGEGKNGLRLCSRRKGGFSHLPPPLDLQLLWQLLEQEFHTPPRRYFRRRLCLPVILDLGYDVSETVIKSLSELGGRFDYPRELVKDQTILLRLEVASRPIVLEGRVIYAVPRMGRNGAVRTETGVVFERLPQEIRELLKNFVLWGFLDAARKRTGEKVFEEGSLFLNVPSGVRRMLEKDGTVGSASC